MCIAGTRQAPFHQLQPVNWMGHLMTDTQMHDMNGPSTMLGSITQPLDFAGHSIACYGHKSKCRTWFACPCSDLTCVTFFVTTLTNFAICSYSICWVGQQIQHQPDQDQQLL